MNAIPKKTLDAAIDAERKYYRSEVTLEDLIASEKPSLKSRIQGT